MGRLAWPSSELWERRQTSASNTHAELCYSTACEYIKVLTSMLISLIIKGLITFLGIVITISLILLGFIDRDNQKLRKAAVILVATWILLITIGMIEFLLKRN